MRKALFLTAFICFLFSILNAQIDLKGTIINQADFPVDSMEVALKSLGQKDLSDKDGKFQITVTDIITQNQKELSAPKFKGNHFIVPVTSGTKPVSIEVFNLKGAKVATVINKQLSAGEHTIPFNGSGLISSSVLIAVVKRGSDMAKFQIIKTGAKGFMVREFAGGVSDYSQTVAKSTPLPVLDSLLFIRRINVEGEAKVFYEFAIPVEKWVDEFEVTLDLIPYEAVEYAISQYIDSITPSGDTIRRTNEDVGKELEEQNIYPYGLERYNNNPGSWAWCSEFHCYIMRIGGYPLGTDAGGSDPDWMMYGHNTLEDWYTQNSDQETEYITTIGNYVPNPGDFIHVTGHTSTVRYVDDNDDLYCVDGNYGDEVRLINRRDYHNISNYLGYGRRSGVIEDSYESVSK